MPYRTSVTGKIYNLKKIEYKKDGEDRVGVEFSVGEPTGRKHPEGHPHAGKSEIGFTRCKSFNDAQAEMILKRFKDGDYISLEGEIRVDSYDRKDVDVVIPRAGQEPLKLKAVVPAYPTLEFIIDRVHFVTDAPEGYTNTSTTISVDAATAAELEAIAAAQVAAQSVAAASTEAPASTGAAQQQANGAGTAGTEKPPF